MNTAGPDDLEKLKPMVSNVKTLFVAGHWPHVSLLDVLPTTGIDFCGAYATSYCGFEEQHRTVVCALHQEEDVRNRFGNFQYLSKDGEIFQFDAWEDFYAITCC